MNIYKRSVHSAPWSHFSVPYLKSSRVFLAEWTNSISGLEAARTEWEQCYHTAQKAVSGYLSGHSLHVWSLCTLQKRKGMAEIRGFAMVQMFVFSQKSCVEILSPEVMLLEGGAFGRWLGHEGSALMNGISVLYKGDQRACLPFHHTALSTNQESVLTRHHAESAGIMILDFPVSRTIRNKCCV